MEGSSPLRLPGARPGGHALRREVLVHHQRERILAAAAELIAERGYRAVSVADIVKGAAIARAKFYENFSSKQDCFLVLFDRGVEEALRRVGEASAKPDAPYAERVAAGVGALLAYMSEQPALARACVVEAPALGPELGERSERARAEFAALLRPSPADLGGVEPPEGLEDSILSGLYSILYNALLSGKPKRIEELAPELVDFALLPISSARGERDAQRHA